MVSLERIDSRIGSADARRGLAIRLAIEAGDLVRAGLAAGEVVCEYENGKARTRG